MSQNKPFKFKQFSIYQDKCAMKVGTDGVLLGAWTQSSPPPKNILDIGTGTGLIALMMAQKFTNAKIDALEIDHAASKQASINFKSSPWKNRIHSIHQSLQKFCIKTSKKYDLIISNPPYFSTDIKSKNNERNIARFTDSLPFSELLDGVNMLLTKEGSFTTIIPFNTEEEFIVLASKQNIYAQHINYVRGNNNAPIKRSLINFSRKKLNSALKKNELTIENSRHNYTNAYIKLTKAFYINM